MKALRWQLKGNVARSKCRKSVGGSKVLFRGLAVGNEANLSMVSTGFGENGS